MITIEERVPFFEGMISQAKENIEKDGDIVGVVITLDEETQDMSIIPCSFSTDDEKDIFAMALKALIEKLGVDFYVHISTGWCFMTDGKTIPDKRPSEHPDRKEVFIANLHHKTGGVRSFMQTFSRDGDKILWDEPQIQNSAVTSFSKFGVWHNKQIVVSEDETKDDYVLADWETIKSTEGRDGQQ